MELVILIGLIILNGVFAMSELAIVSSRRSRLQMLASEHGSAGAKVALELLEHPNRFLSTVQIGITFVGVLAGAFGGQTIARDLADTIRQQIPALTDAADTIGVIVVVGLTTYLSLVIGELVPKHIALNNPERVAALVAPPMRLLSRIAAPLVALLSFSTNIIVRLMGIRSSDDPPVTEMEILSMIREGAEAGFFADDEEGMVEGVLQLDDRRIGSIITPRTEIVWFDVNDDLETIREKLNDGTFTTYPIVDGNMDNVLGVVRSKDLLFEMLHNRPIDLRSLMVEPLFVPESVSIARVVQQFKATGIHTAMIVGEYGGIEGIVRMHDIVEEIFGELDSHAGGDPDVVQRDDGSWLLDGQFPLNEFDDMFPDFSIPEREVGNYETVAGFVMARLGRVPDAADNFAYQGLYFEVMDMDEVRVDKVLVRVLETDDKPEEGDA